MAGRAGGLDLRAVRRSITAAQQVVEWFGRHSISTAENSWLLAANGVTTFLADLPGKYAAMLLPSSVKGQRALMLSSRIPSHTRWAVLLHENGHLFQGTAREGVTYDQDDWLDPAEQGADAFAAVGMLPRRFVDEALDSHIWLSDVVNDIALQLQDLAEGIWTPDRAIVIAENRLRVREKIGV